ncbi:hypothetical protein E2562_034853 [Oryza meyeriana var. granulata]|uniref:Uncharacterized protein n=1 Tax=Oryza meyeriana var. granulata TaxID=110450 RepID=A0A6G1E6K2_9ORYZ|nr:hypothetical protein E2562_034853 [Oryza meyeriana var. granulata]
MEWWWCKRSRPSLLLVLVDRIASALMQNVTLVASASAAASWALSTSWTAAGDLGWLAPARLRRRGDLA